MTPTTYGRDFAYCLKSHGGVRGFNASLWRFLLRCTLFCHGVATFLTSVSSYEGGCGFEEYYNFLYIYRKFVAMVKSILQANTIELHYWMDDNSHIIDANIQNKCERELLDILDSIAGQWGLSVTIETMPLANGGVIRWFRLKAKSFKRALNGKEKTIYIAIVTTLATTIIATPITTTIESIVQQTIENIFADEEVKQMQKENLRLDIELKQEMLRQIQQQDKIEKTSNPQPPS